MNKKTLLVLTPFVLAVLPIVSCNKTDPKVNEQEFKDALNYVVTKNDARKFFINGNNEIEMLYTDQSTVKNPVVIELTAMGLDEFEKTTTSQEGKTNETKIYYKTKDSIEYKYDTSAGKKWEFVIGTEILPCDRVAINFSTYINKFSSFAFNANKYTMPSTEIDFKVEGRTIKADAECVLTFENKKIKTINETIVMKGKQTIGKNDSKVVSQITLKTNCTFSQYGSATIKDIPEFKEPANPTVTSEQWNDAIKTLYVDTKKDKRNYTFSCIAIDQSGRRNDLDFKADKDTFNARTFTYYYEDVIQTRVNSSICLIDTNGVITDVLAPNSENDLLKQNVEDYFKDYVDRFADYKFDLTSKSYKYKNESLESEFQFDENKRLIKHCLIAENATLTYTFSNYGTTTISTPSSPSNVLNMNINENNTLLSDLVVVSPSAKYLCCIDLDNGAEGFNLKNKIKIELIDKQSKASGKLYQIDYVNANNELKTLDVQSGYCIEINSSEFAELKQFNLFVKCDSSPDTPTLQVKITSE